MRNRIHDIGFNSHSSKRILDSGFWIARIQHPASSLYHLISSIQHPASIPHPLTKICALIIISLLSKAVEAQVYPVQGTATLIPPYSLRLSDYATSTSERFVLNTLLADVTKPELHVRFRISLVGQNIKLDTKPEYMGSPIALQGGVPLRLTNVELAEYFDPNHLNFSGISKSDFLKTGFLPEGFYQFSFEVYEYNRGVKISSTITAPAWLVLNDPPLINAPRNGEKLKALSPQNVILQWTPRHTGSPNAAFTTEYEIRVVEVWPANRNVNDAILSQPAIYETTTNSTTLIYGPDATQLEPGRTYAFRVQAKAMTGAEQFDLFKNNGYSETVAFIFGDACDAPTNITGQAESPTRISLQWDTSPTQTGYTVEYRQKGQTNWYSSTSLIPDTEVSGLQPNTTYEYQLMSTCGSFESNYGNIATITTPDMAGKGYSCGVAPPDFNLDPSQLLPMLNVGDVVNAGDFDVTISKVSGATGTFSGEGAVVVPFLNQVKGLVAFSDITVNNDKRMVNGFMNVTGGAVEVVPQNILDLNDKLSQGLNILDSALAIAKNLIPTTPLDPGSFIADTLIVVKDGISKVYKDITTGKIIVVDNKGQSQELPAGANVALTDGNGKGALVSAGGGIANTSSTLAKAATQREYNLNLTFAKGSTTAYGLDNQQIDALNANYEKISEKYFVGWKAVSTSGGDPITASYSGKDVKLEEIKFDQGGAPLTAKVSGSTIQLTAFSVAAETTSSIIARITPADTTKKEQILGKLNVVGYDPKPHTVHIVPVNGIKPGASAPTIQQQLNQIYSQAVVSWTVTLDSSVTVKFDSLFDNGSSGLLSNYTGDMKKVINTYGTLNTDEYYLFLVPSGTNANENGYMPRSKQCGFLFMDATKPPVTTDLVRTMAHELGHGAFTLKHLFADYTAIPQNSTDNLMDYNNGTSLLKYQWERIHDPVTVLGLFESDAAGASQGLCTDANNIISEYSKRNYLDGLIKTDDDLLKYIQSNKLWQSDAIVSSLENLSTDFSKKYFMIPKDDENYFDAKTWLKNNDAANTEQLKKDQARFYYMRERWDDIVFRSLHHKACNSSANYTSRANFIKQTVTEKILKPTTLNSSGKFVLSDSREYDLPDPLRYYNSSKRNYDFERLLMDIQYGAINRYSNALNGSVEKELYLEVKFQNLIKMYGDIMVTVGADNIVGLADEGLKKNIIQRFNELRKSSFDNEFRFKWIAMVGEREQAERAAILQKIRMKELQEALKIAENEAKNEAILEITTGTVSIFFIVIFPPASALEIVGAIGSGAFAVDQVYGGISTMNSIQNGIFDPNKEYKIIRGFLIDVGGSKAALAYDLTNILIGVRSVRSNLKDLVKIEEVNSTISGDKLKMIFKAIETQNESVDTGGDIYELKKN